MTLFPCLHKYSAIGSTSRLGLQHTLCCREVQNPIEIVVRKSLATVLLGVCTLLILGVQDPLDCFYFLLQLNEYIFVHHYWVKSTATSVVGVVGLEATWCHRSAIEQRAARDSGLTGADQSTDAPDDSSHPAFNSHSIWANRPKPPTNRC